MLKILRFASRHLTLAGLVPASDMTISWSGSARGNMVRQ